MTRSSLPDSRTASGGNLDPSADAFDATLAMTSPRVSVVTSELPCLKKGMVDPVLISIANTQVVSGLSRSEIYRRMAAGDIRAVKAGSRTLIVLQSLIDHLNALPAATFQVSAEMAGTMTDDAKKSNTSTDELALLASTRRAV